MSLDGARSHGDARIGARPVQRRSCSALAVVWALVVVECVSPGRLGAATCDQRLDFAAEYYTYTLPSRATALAVGDWNEDGRPDLATAGNEWTTVGSPQRASIEIQLSAGAFRFQPGTALPIEVGPPAINLVTADMNRDGHADLVLGGEHSTTVFLGDGHGGFRSAATFGFAGQVAVADFDRDGEADILLADWTTATILFLHDLAIESQASMSIGFSGVAVADFNEDGLPDLVTNMRGAVVQLNRGGGQFETSAPVYPDPYEDLGPTFAGDRNGDGHQDVVLFYGYSGLTIFGRGDGTFGAPSAVTEQGGRQPAPRPSTARLDRQDPNHVPQPPWLAAVTDLNGDGKADLVFASSERGEQVQGQRSAGMPHKVVAADMDGDGNMDLVAAEGLVAIHPGIGGGRIRRDPTFEFGLEEDPSECHVADLNRDGIDDLVVYTYEGSLALLGTGTAAFGRPRGLPDETRPLAFADVDGDGIPDLLTDDGTLYPGIGDGTFRDPGGGSPTGVEPRCVVVGDLDEDGRPDAVTADAGSGTLSVLMGTGEARFRPAQRIDVGGHPSSVALGDLNRDGHADLVVPNTASGTVSPLFGAGDGTFARVTEVAAGVAPTTVAIGDLNADGEPDVATGDGTTGAVTVLLGQGDGTLGTGTAYPAGLSLAQVAIADLDRDTHPDLLAVDLSGNAVSVLLGNGDGTFGAARSFATGVNPTSVAIADFDLNGALDVAATTSAPSAQSVSLLLGNGDGTFEPGLEVATHVQPPGSIAAGDLDGDGRADLVVGGAVLSLILNRGDGNFDQPTLLRTKEPASSIAVADLDGDGRADLATASQGALGQPGYVGVLLGDGRGGFRWHSDIRDYYGARVTSVSAGDIDEDGHADLVLVPFATPSNTTDALLLMGAGGGRFHAPTALDLRARWLQLIDMDRDGHLDVVSVAETGGTVAYGTGHATFPDRAELTASGSLALPALADVDGDGRIDVLSSGANFLNRGRAFERVDSGRQGMLSGFKVTWPVVADLDGDGKADIGTGMLLGNGDGTFHPWTGPAFSPWGAPQVVMDWDRDGRPDLINFQQNDEDGYSITGTLILNATLRNRAPAVASAKASVARVWPPSRDFVDVDLAGVSDPDGDPVTLIVTGITQDEPADGGASGASQCPDATIADGRARIRLDRAGNGNGRVYELTFTATDACGASREGRATVCVPHERDQPCVDDGQRYLSTQCVAARPGDGEAPAAPFGVEVGADRVFLRYTLERDSDVQVDVLDVAGRRIARLDSGRRSAGPHRVEWQGAANGIYFARIAFAGRAHTERIVLLR